MNNKEKWILDKINFDNFHKDKNGRNKINENLITKIKEFEHILVFEGSEEQELFWKIFRDDKKTLMLLTNGIQVKIIDKIKDEIIKHKKKHLIIVDNDDGGTEIENYFNKDQKFNIVKINKASGHINVFDTEELLMKENIYPVWLSFFGNKSVWKNFPVKIDEDNISGHCKEYKKVIQQLDSVLNQSGNILFKKIFEKYISEIERKIEEDKKIPSFAKIDSPQLLGKIIFSNSIIYSLYLKGKFPLAVEFEKLIKIKFVKYITDKKNYLRIVEKTK